MKNFLFLLIVVPMLLATGCSESESMKTNPIAGTQRDYSEAELHQLLAPGTALAAVTNAFGPPVSTSTRDSNAALLLYTFPFNEKRPPGSLSGFTVKIDGGRVSGWLPIKRGGSPYPQFLREFLVYTATEEEVPLVSEFKTNGIASASRLHRRPDLTLRGRILVDPLESEKPGEWPVTLALDEKSAADIRAFTETNSGTQLLVVFETNIVAAPLSAPIRSKQVRFSLRSKEIFDKLRNN
jgi:hypothetical protein